MLSVAKNEIMWIQLGYYQIIHCWHKKSHQIRQKILPRTFRRWHYCTKNLVVSHIKYILQLQTTCTFIYHSIGANIWRQLEIGLMYIYHSIGANIWRQLEIGLMYIVLQWAKKRMGFSISLNVHFDINILKEKLKFPLRHVPLRHGPLHHGPLHYQMGVNTVEKNTVKK